MSRCLFVPATWKLLNDTSKLRIRAAQWTNYKWSAEHSKRTSVHNVFILKASSRPLGMGSSRRPWFKFNRLLTGVGRFYSSIYKWGLAPLSNFDCGRTVQTTDHVISKCSIHRTPRGVAGLTILTDNARCWLNTTAASIRSHRFFFWMLLHTKKRSIVMSFKMMT